MRPSDCRLMNTSAGLSSHTAISGFRVVSTAYRPICTRLKGIVPTAIVPKDVVSTACRPICTRLKGIVPTAIVPKDVVSTAYRPICNRLERHRPNGNRPKGCRLNGMLPIYYYYYYCIDRRIYLNLSKIDSKRRRAESCEACCQWTLL